MTLKECIEYVDLIKPNAFDEATKTRWVNELEGRVQTEVFLFGPDNITTYTWDQNQDTELFVKPPYEDIYYEYLQARIDYANGEYDKYENTMAMFEAKWIDFKVWFIYTYHPADNRGGCTCTG